ncbi:MAG: hypothetical protein WC360_04495 [Opitutales bacterium]|jgi:hypothetical protein
MRTTRGISGRFAAWLPALCLLLAPPAPLPGQQQDAGIVPDSPVERFRIYGFDQQSGWRAWQMEGRLAEFPGGGLVTVRDMRLRVFAPDAEQSVELVIDSPVASVPPSQGAVSGPDEIFVTAKGFLLGGEDWTWHTQERRLTIRAKAHAVIDGVLGPILE